MESWRRSRRRGRKGRRGIKRSRKKKVEEKFNRNNMIKKKNLTGGNYMFL